MEREIKYGSPVLEGVQSAYRVLMRKVYLWMSLALAVTGMTSFYIASNPGLLQTIFTSRGIFLMLIIAELALVFILSARIMKMSFATAGIMFAAYSNHVVHLHKIHDEFYCRSFLRNCRNVCGNVFHRLHTQKRFSLIRLFLFHGSCRTGHSHYCKRILG